MQIHKSKLTKAYQIFVVMMQQFNLMQYREKQQQTQNNQASQEVQKNKEQQKNQPDTAVNAHNSANLQENDQNQMILSEQTAVHNILEQSKIPTNLQLTKSLQQKQSFLDDQQSDCIQVQATKVQTSIMNVDQLYKKLEAENGKSDQKTINQQMLNQNAQQQQNKTQISIQKQQDTNKEGQHAIQQSSDQKELGVKGRRKLELVKTINLHETVFCPPKIMPLPSIPSLGDKRPKPWQKMAMKKVAAILPTLMTPSQTTKTETAKTETANTQTPAKIQSISSQYTGKVESVQSQSNPTKTQPLISESKSKIESVPQQVAVDNKISELSQKKQEMQRKVENTSVLPSVQEALASTSLLIEKKQQKQGDSIAERTFIQDNKQDVNQTQINKDENLIDLQTNKKQLPFWKQHQTDSVLVQNQQKKAVELDVQPQIKTQQKNTSSITIPAQISQQLSQERPSESQKKIEMKLEQENQESRLSWQRKLKQLQEARKERIKLQMQGRQIRIRQLQEKLKAQQQSLKDESGQMSMPNKSVLSLCSGVALGGLSWVVRRNRTFSLLLGAATSAACFLLNY